MHFCGAHNPVLSWIHYATQCFADTAFGGQERAPMYEAIASAVFAIPQIGQVGLTEEAAGAKVRSVHEAVSFPSQRLSLSPRG